MNATNLIAGPYHPPPLRKGDRAVCLYRDSDVIITSWSGARIPWPRCRVRGQRGGSGLLVNDELARAVRTESVLAICHWFGVSGVAVWSWRRALGIGQWGTEGSRRLHAEASEKGARKTRGKWLPPDQVERRRRTALQLGLKPTGRWREDGWTPEQLALLGTMPDAKLARRIGRTARAVQQRRILLGIPSAKDRRRRENR